VSRYVVVRDEDSGERLVEESTVPTEAMLHQVLMRHPELVPATDLGFGRVATVGYEASLSSGSADLVLLDEAGKLCIVEVKKEGNPDTRRVVAQLLDYAAAMWGLTVDEFDERIVRRQAGPEAPRTLRQIVTEDLVGDTAEPDMAEQAVDDVLEHLGETLRTGDFALVLAAPIVPPGVAQAIEYLNARGLSVFGLEVSYFAGAVEAFVPRLVVRPSISGRIAGQDANAPSDPVTPANFFDGLPEVARGPLAGFIDEIAGMGGEVQWRTYGPRVRVRGEAGPKVMVTFDRQALWLTSSPRKGLDTDTIVRAAVEFRKVPGARAGSDLDSLRWGGADQEQIRAALLVVRELVRELTMEGAT